MTSFNSYELFSRGHYGSSARGYDCSRLHSSHAVGDYLNLNHVDTQLVLPNHLTWHRVSCLKIVKNNT